MATEVLGLATRKHQDWFDDDDPEEARNLLSTPCIIHILLGSTTKPIPPRKEYITMRNRQHKSNYARRRTDGDQTRLKCSNLLLINMT